MIQTMSPSIHSRESRLAAFELKFLVPPAAANEVRFWAFDHLTPDPHADVGAPGRYSISSLYFDTPDFAVFHKLGSFGRGKYRVRRYGQSDWAFLERKLRTRKALTKRRSLLSLEDLHRLSAPTVEHKWSGTWFQRRILARRLRPVCQVSYARSAFYAMTNQVPIRLTIDDQLAAAPIHEIRFAQEPEIPVLRDLQVLEMKFSCAMPGMFKTLIERFQLNVTPFSKYRSAARALGLAPGAMDAESLAFSSEEHLPTDERADGIPVANNAGTSIGAPVYA